MTINKEGYEKWLRSGTYKRTAQKLSRMPILESKLVELGLPFKDLDEAWSEDQFESLYELLGILAKGGQVEGKSHKEIFTDSDRLKYSDDTVSFLKTYARYLNGEPPGKLRGGTKPVTNPRDKEERVNNPRNRKNTASFKGTKNLILYGPPGTGKTHKTAEEAVRLCGREISDEHDRGELMKIYRELRAKKRIEFVTFHQSMAYEDFVEGRQPVTGSSEDQGASHTGFRLETVPGIFRRIANRAERNYVSSSILNRRVFKMSIGEADNPEEAHLFEEAINNGYALLGWDDLDWTDEKYSDKGEILNAVNNSGLHEKPLSATSGAVRMPYQFRNEVQVGDRVIVSKGVKHFRAIGEFTGEYEFHPRPEGGYAHRRAVHWIWHDHEGRSVDEISTKNFTPHAIFEINLDNLKVQPLRNLISSQLSDGVHELHSYVLIIDEINRANISKVFGELITLLEPDKRLGLPNELIVRLPYSGDEFGVPPNLHIVATMNSADRSIALLDTALRRRFKFREMMPDPEPLKRIKTEEGTPDLIKILKTLNERIEYLYDREHQIGHSYFMDCKTRDKLDEVMRDKIIPLLAEYFFDDWDKIAYVLGDHPGDARDEHKGAFLDREKLKEPPKYDDEGQSRYRWTVRSGGFAYNRLLNQS